jgi:hypothetical protein
MNYIVIFIGIAVLIYAYFNNIPRPTTTDIAEDLFNIVLVIIVVVVIVVMSII